MLVILYTASAVMWWRHLVGACVLYRMGAEIPLGECYGIVVLCAARVIGENTKI